MKALAILLVTVTATVYGLPANNNHNVQGLYPPQQYQQYSQQRFQPQTQNFQPQAQATQVRPARQLPPVYGPPTNNYSPRPQSSAGGYNYPQPQQPLVQPSQIADGSAQQGNYQQQQQYQPEQGPSASNGFGQSAGPSGSGATVECQMRQSTDNRFAFSCEGVNPQLVTLKSEQILWLQNPSGSAQTVDIEVPNYKIEDFIKAYFKQGGPGGNNRINVLLKKPEQSWEAAAQTPTAGTFTPQVQLQYEAVPQPQVIHYPKNTPYRPGQLPPLPE